VKKEGRGVDKMFTKEMDARIEKAAHSVARVLPIVESATRSGTETYEEVLEKAVRQAEVGLAVLKSLLEEVRKS
jgi:hypothetical protein